LEDNKGILDENNRLAELNMVSVVNDRQSFERTVYTMFPNPEIYTTFKLR
jgi:hypothetical protein